MRERKKVMLGGSSRRDGFVESPYTFKVRLVCLPHNARTFMLTARLLSAILLRNFDKSDLMFSVKFSQACLDKQNSAAAFTGEFLQLHKSHIDIINKVRFRNVQNPSKRTLRRHSNSHHGTRTVAFTGWNSFRIYCSMSFSRCNDYMWVSTRVTKVRVGLSFVFALC